jgi:hypothetical protein
MTTTRQPHDNHKTRQNTRQGKTKNKTRQDRAGQDKTRQDRTGQDRTRFDVSPPDRLCLYTEGRVTPVFFLVRLAARRVQTRMAYAEPPGLDTFQQQMWSSFVAIIPQIGLPEAQKRYGHMLKQHNICTVTRCLEAGGCQCFHLKEPLGLSAVQRNMWSAFLDTVKHNGVELAVKVIEEPTSVKF